MTCRKILVSQSMAAAVLVSLCVFAGCGKSAPKSAERPSENLSAEKQKKKEYVFALIAKSQSNPVFRAAQVGAEDAARDLSAKLGVDIKMDWRTPNDEDAQKQAEYIEQLVVQGVDGISISCSIADTVTPAIDAAVKQGVPVMCFDSDAPNSKRFCCHATNDVEAGRLVMHELIKELGPGKHVVGIPGGSQNAVNIQNRIKGAVEEAKKYPNITVKGPYYFKETPQDAAAKVEEAQTANPDIDGWAMVSAICLFTDALMNWEPGKVKIVAMDALPVELPYVRKGVVQKLFAQQTYIWGYRSIELLADKVILGQDPPQVKEDAVLVPVTQENVDEFEKNWKKWLRQGT